MILSAPWLSSLILDPLGRRGISRSWNSSNLGAASKATASCSNRPVTCLHCWPEEKEEGSEESDEGDGLAGCSRVVWSYHMADHIRLCHPNIEVPDEYQLSKEESQRVLKLHKNGVSRMEAMRRISNTTSSNRSPFWLKIARTESVCWAKRQGHH